MSTKVIKIKLEDLADNPTDFTIESIKEYLEMCLADVDIGLIEIEELIVLQ